MAKLWFKRKRYGWGWMPSSWEGWTSIAIALGAIVAIATQYPDQPWPALGVILTVAIVLIALGYWKGETPRWQWGSR